MGLRDSRAPQRPSRIVIADDHPLFRCALVRMFDAASDLGVVGEAANGHQALELCRRLRPELVLVDLRMPQMDGIAATYAIKKKFPDTLVIILTAFDESTGLSESLQASAAGYVLEHSPAAQITDAVRSVLAGESPVNEKRAQAAGTLWTHVSSPVVHVRERALPALPGCRHAKEKRCPNPQSLRGSSRRPCLWCQPASDSSGNSGKCLSFGPEGISHQGGA